MNDAVLTFLVYPLLALAVAGFVYVQAYADHIQAHWIDYQCHPAVIPVAGFFKDGRGQPVDAFANAQFCSQKIGHAVLSVAMEPVYYMMSAVGETLGSATGSVNDIRSLLTRMRSAMTSFIDNVVNRMVGAVSEVTVLMNRMRDILQRMVGNGTLMIGITTAIMSMLDNFQKMAMSFLQSMVYAAFAAAIVLSFMFPEFLAFTISIGASLGIVFCFDPATPVELTNGNNVRMDELQLGDALLGGDIVEGMLRVSGDGVRLYELHGVRVSGTHKVLHDGVWKYVRDHPEANLLDDGLPELCCLITDTHRVMLNGMLFTDFEEVGEPEQLRAIECMVWGAPVGETCAPGLHAGTPVVLADDRLVAIEDVKVGMELPGDDVVLGVVRVASEGQWSCYDGLVASPHAWLFLSEVGWRQADRLGTALHEETEAPYWNLITRQGYFWVKGSTGLLLIRDYLDTHNEAVLGEIETYCLGELQKCVQTDLGRLAGRPVK